MKYLIVSGSSRKDSQSARVAGYLKDRLKSKVGNDSEIEILSLEGNPLPLWDEEFGIKAGDWQKTWAPIGEKLQAADAFVFVVPEWHGMVPPNFKNLLFLAGQTLAHKPALITTVSSGMGGAYVVSELRSSSYKNNFVTYLPEQLVLRNVGTLLNSKEPASEIDQAVRERIEHDLSLLKAYAAAFKQIRSTPDIAFDRYPNGM